MKDSLPPQHDGPFLKSLKVFTMCKVIWGFLFDMIQRVCGEMYEDGM